MSEDQPGPGGWIDLGRLPWYLKVLLFAVAIFLIALPYILIIRSNAYNEAVRAYDNLCRASASGNSEEFRHLLDSDLSRIGSKTLNQWVSNFVCLDRRSSTIQFKKDETGYYWLRVIHGSKHEDVRFRRRNNVMYWSPIEDTPEPQKVQTSRK